MNRSYTSDISYLPKITLKTQKKLTFTQDSQLDQSYLTKSRSLHLANEKPSNNIARVQPMQLDLII